MTALPSHIIDRLLDLNRPSQLRAALRLYQLAGADGVAVLTGGVRGWSETLGCGRSYPKVLFAELEQLEIVEGVEFYAGEGGQVAEVHLTPADSITDQTSPPAPSADDHAPPHQDAENHAADRSVIATPHTPLYGTDHDLTQQQQYARNAEPDMPTGRGGADYWVAWALSTFPNEPTLIRAVFLHPQANFTTARNLFSARPDLTLAQWEAELKKASELDHIKRPWGLAVSQLTVGQEIAPIRAAPARRPPDGQRRQHNHRGRGGQADEKDRGVLTPEKIARYKNDPLYKVGDGSLPAPPAPPAGAPPPRPAPPLRPTAPSPAPPGRDWASWEATAVALLGDRPPNSLVERSLLRQSFDAGSSPQQAVETLRKRREPPKRSKREPIFRPL